MNSINKIYLKKNLLGLHNRILKSIQKGEQRNVRNLERLRYKYFSNKIYYSFIFNHLFDIKSLNINFVNVSSANFNNNKVKWYWPYSFLHRMREKGLLFENLPILKNQMNVILPTLEERMLHNFVKKKENHLLWSLKAQIYLDKILIRFRIRKKLGLWNINYEKKVHKNFFFGVVSSISIRHHKKEIKHIIKNSSTVPISILINRLNASICKWIQLNLSSFYIMSVPLSVVEFKSEKLKFIKKFGILNSNWHANSSITSSNASYLLKEMTFNLHRFLWKWAKRRHNNLSNRWIFEKYWFQTITSVTPISVTRLADFSHLKFNKVPAYWHHNVIDQDILVELKFILSLNKNANNSIFFFKIAYDILNNKNSNDKIGMLTWPWPITWYITSFLIGSLDKKKHNWKNKPIFQQLKKKSWIFYSKNGSSISYLLNYTDSYQFLI